MDMQELRKKYHRRICEEIIRITHDRSGKSYPNFCDGSNRASIMIGSAMMELLGYVHNTQPIKEQTVGGLFEIATRDYIRKAFRVLSHIRPGNWVYSTGHTRITEFEQYEHLDSVETIVAKNKLLKTALGGNYLVRPDIIIARMPIPDEEINASTRLVSAEDKVARLSPLRAVNRHPPLPILHASISCKWSIRSDRSQNTRTEALNLIRNRKGPSPHIIAVTAEPLPTRIAALALGTGDLDCVYHFALAELTETLQKLDNEDQADMLTMMVEGRRLRDISDLPLDLAI